MNVNQAIGQWFMTDPQKLKLIAQCSFYLNTDLKILTIDCPDSILSEIKVLSGEMGQSMVKLGVKLIRLTCQAELISQFSPVHAIYVQELHRSQRRQADTD